MSGDNLHGDQPIKFYSEDLTLTKVLLIKNHFNFEYQFSDINDADQNYKLLKKLLAS